MGALVRRREGGTSTSARGIAGNIRRLWREARRNYRGWRDRFTLRGFDFFQPYSGDEDERDHYDAVRTERSRRTPVSDESHNRSFYDEVALSFGHPRITPRRRSRDADLRAPESAMTVALPANERRSSGTGICCAIPWWGRAVLK